MTSRRNLDLLIQALLSKESKPFYQVIAGCLYLAIRSGMSPGEYFCYGLNKKSAAKGAHLNYMSSNSHFLVHLPALNNSENQSLFNKLDFKKKMIEHGLKTPETLGYAGPQTQAIQHFDPINPGTIIGLMTRKNVHSFIVKPATGTQGRGVHLVLFKKDADRPFVCGSNQFSASEFFSFLNLNCGDTEKNQLIFETFVKSHRSLKTISPSANPNIRIVTVRTPEGDVHITRAAASLGRAGSVMSNVGSGGLLASINQETGEILACRTNTYLSGSLITSHPDTGKDIVGFKIPCWHDILAQCVSAARAFPDIHTIGWDVLVTEERPVILEGNDDWDIIAQQVFGEGYLSEENKQLLSRFGLIFPDKITLGSGIKNCKNALFGIGA